MSPALVALISLAVVAYAATIALFVVRSLVRQNPNAARARFQELTRALGARREDDLTLAFDSHGLHLSVSWRKPHKQPAVLAVATSLPPEHAGSGNAGYRALQGSPLAERHAILLRRETLIDRLGKALGINREVQTGDSVFDETVYIESAAPDASVEQVLRAPEVRQGIRELFDLGWTRVRLYEGTDLVSAQRLNPGPEQFDATLMRQSAPALSRIAGRIPAAEGVPTRGKLSAPAVFAMLAPVLGAGAWLGFLFARQAWPPLSDQPYWAGVGCGAAAWLLAQVGAARLVRGRSDSFRTFLVHFFVSFPAWLGVGLVAVVALNGGTDDSGPSTHTVPVHRMWITSSKNARQYHLEVGGWKSASDVEVRVDPALYGLLHEGSSVVVVTHPGSLGWEWVEQVRTEKDDR